MKQWGITAEARKMAWKMVETIFPHAALSKDEQDLLLTLATIISLDDLLNSHLSWSQPPPARTALCFRGRSVILETTAREAFYIKTRYSDTEIQRAADRAEEVFDRSHLEELERASLFTALPCLGLDALADFLRWKKEPPFPELE